MGGIYAWAHELARRHDDSNRDPRRSGLGRRAVTHTPAARFARSRVFHEGRGAFVIVCGGIGRHGPAEAEVMAALLRTTGVPDEAIRLESRSTNTSENLRFALPILHDLGATRVLIVSDAYHLPRARLIARRLGLIATGSAPYAKGAQRWPHVKGWLREIPGLLAVLLRIR